MKNILFRLAIAICLFTNSAGCTNYLDVVPDNVATMEMVFNNRTSAEKYLSTCYWFLPESGKNGADPGMDVGDEVWYYGDKSTDFTNQSTFWIAMGKQNTNAPLVDFWSGGNWGKPMFQGLRNCNIFLENIDKVGDMTPQERAQWAAEAKTIKAYLHFWLLRMYGPIPVIRVNIPVNATQEQVRVSREKIDPIVEYITSLIDESYADLPLKIASPASEMGRLTRPAALAIKAQILTTAASPFFNGNTSYANFLDADGEPFFNQTFQIEKWERAEQACSLAIACAKEAGHDLFNYVNTSSYELGEQTLMELTNRCKVTDRWNNELIYGVGGNGILDLQVLCQPWLEANYSADDRYYYAKNGTFAPTLAVAETFYTHNGVPIDEDKEWDFENRYTTRVAVEAEKQRIKPGYTTAKLHFDREPRFYATLGFDGSSWYGVGKLDDKNMHYLQAKAKQSAGKKSNRNFSITGYFAKKLVRYQNSMVPASIQIEPYPFPIIRLADLYLLYAEALNEASKDKGEVPEECYLYLDLVRARAGFPDGVRADWKAHSNNPTKPESYQGFQTIVRQERMIELALEGKRFWDIRRWNQSQNYFNKAMRGWDIDRENSIDYYTLRTYAIREYSHRDNLWPLRNYDLIVNPKLVQNPGW